MKQMTARSYCLLVLILSPGFCMSILGQSALFDMRQLNDHGVVFEGPYEVASHSLGMYDIEGVGDTDGDGLDDVVVIYVEEPSGSLDFPPPAAAIIFGRDGLLSRHTLPDAGTRSTVFRVSLDQFVGLEKVRSVGDINGDGLADFALGADNYPGGGRIFLVFGSREYESEYSLEEVGTERLPGVQFWSSLEATRTLGRSFASIGDVNGDGRADLAFGAPFYSSEETGALFVLFETRDLPPETDLAGVGDSLPGVLIRGGKGLSLGYGVSSAGDVDGDGLDDFLVGTKYDGVFLVRGLSDWPALLQVAPNSPAEENVTRFLDFKGSDSFFCSPGDMNNDGLSDIVLADPGTISLFESEEAVVYLIFGRADYPRELSRGDLEQLAVKIGPFRASSSFGNFVGPAGDLNLDGIPDLFIGAPEASRDGLLDVGEAYVLYGRRDWPVELELSDGFEGIRLLGEGNRHYFGSRIRLAGDFNGDGLPDLAALAAFRALSSIPPDVGRAYVIYGFGSEPPLFTLLDIEPGFGPVRGGTGVIVRGSGFGENPQVLFGDRPSPMVSVISGSEIRATTPPASGLGTVDVSVRISGVTQRLPGAFEYTRNLSEIDLSRPGEDGFVLQGDIDEILGLSTAFGDVTGDGVDDLLAGTATVGGSAWSVVVVRGGSELPDVLSAFEPSPWVSRIVSRTPSFNPLPRVTAIGDINGDGIDDLGISGSNVPGYLFFGRRDFPAEVCVEDEVLSGGAVLLEKLTFPGEEPPEFVYAPAGDVTGDGIADLAVGYVARHVNPDGLAPPFLDGTGNIFYLAGRESWLEVLDLDDPLNVHSRLTGSREGHGLGRELTSVGDVNGDGFPDLLASSSSTPSAIGPAYVLYGSRELPDLTDVDSFVAAGGGAAIEIELLHGSWYDRTNQLQVGAAGDTNADGYDDLLLSFEGAGILNQGATFLVFGGPDLPPSTYLRENPANPDGVVRMFGEGSRTQTGGAMPIGDFDADGYDDFAVRAVAFLDDVSFEEFRGVVFLMLGREHLPQRIELRNLGGAGVRLETAPISLAVLTAEKPGDLNADGRPDFALMEQRFEAGGIRQDVHVVYGLSPEVPFIRGDSTFDGELNISDPVFTLSFLFLGGEGPRCGDSADTDDGGTLDLTDAVYVLSYLFLGGPEPPAPFSEPGDDPTDDALTCRGF